MQSILIPTSGSVIIGNTKINGLTEKEMCRIRLEKLGYIYQSFNLLPFLTVEENIFLPLRFRKENLNLYLDRYNELLTELGISNKKQSYINELSGGKQQRVASARCLLSSPNVILADEPTGNLDSENSNNFMKLLTELCKTQGVTVVMVTHENELLRYADSVIKIKDGKIQD